MDLDYFVQHIYNCALVDLEDILQNGTVINGTKIEKPHSFSTACNIATQVSAIIASNQYGGQTMSFSHLAPFVDVSRKKIYRELMEEREIVPDGKTEQELSSIVEKRLKDEIKRGVQMIQYQLNTLLTTNGQTPFITMFMYLGEVKDAKTKNDLAMIIEEVLRQRYQGVKNENGAWISPAFPKLIYVLEEDNIREDSPYWYLTKLAAECSAKRLVPDYISEKKMIEMKGYCFPCMGAARGDETVSIKIKNNTYYHISIENAFNIIRDVIRTQNHNNSHKAILSDFNNVCGVYKLTHTLTGLFYIGSSKNIARRLMEHRYSMSHKGTLGDRYFIGDYNTEHLSYELLEACSLDEMYKVESKYIDFKNKDSMCVNQKDPINNGNFNSENRLLALAGKKYSTFKNSWKGTWVKFIKDNSNIFILSNDEWVPIRAIMKNIEDCPLRMFEISYKIGNELHTLNITEDHPFEIYERGRVETKDIVVGDRLIDSTTHETYEITEVRETGEHCETFDFTVDNDMFDLSGIVSHNCRSFLSPWIEHVDIEPDEEFEIQ